MTTVKGTVTDLKKMYRHIWRECQKIPKNQKSLLKIGLDESAGCEIVGVTEDGSKTKPRKG